MSTALKMPARAPEKFQGSSMRPSDASACQQGHVQAPEHGLSGGHPTPRRARIEPHANAGCPACPRSLRGGNERHRPSVCMGCISMQAFKQKWLRCSLFLHRLKSGRPGSPAGSGHPPHRRLSADRGTLVAPRTAAQPPSAQRFTQLASIRHLLPRPRRAWRGAALS
jgi:hypothetical protein